MSPMTEVESPQAPTPKSTKDRGRRRMYALLALMFLAFALVVIYRREIRVRWWGYRLAATSDLTKRTHYLGLLATEPERAAPVARDLLAADDAATRSFGVALALRVPGPAGEQLLQKALHDKDSSVRQGAILGLSVRRSATVVPTLRALADDPDLNVAMTAVEGLVTAGGDDALQALAELARHHPQVGVRAQAIAALGETRAPEAVPALIDCLTDNAVFDGLTVSEQDALDALQHVAPQMEAQTEMPRDVHRSNAARAAIALHVITGQDFGFLDAAPEDRAAIIAAWRAWYAKQ